MAIGMPGVEPIDEVMLNLRSGGEQIIDGRPSASSIPENSGKESNLIFSGSSPSVITNRPRCNNLRSFSLFSCQGARYAAANRPKRLTNVGNEVIDRDTEVMCD